MICSTPISAQDTLTVDKVPNLKQQYNNQLRHYFEGLNRPENNYNFLYEMAVHSVDTSINPKCFDTMNNDTTHINFWLNQYREVRYMAYDTSQIMPALDFGKKSADTIIATQKIPIGIIHVNYYRLKEEAITTNNYFLFDTINNTIADNPNRTSSPYLNNTVFSASALFPNHKAKVTFIIDKEWFLLDSETEVYYNSGNYDLVVNFDDGSGNQTFDASQRHEVEVDSAGRKFIEITLVERGTGIVKGSGKTSTRSKSRASEDIYPGTYELPSSEYQGLKIRIIPACTPIPPTSDGSKKVAIVVGGFDPFTRLFISIDAPHQGANIPLAYQHTYRTAENLFNLEFISLFGFIWDNLYALTLLDTPAAQQMLAYHVDTKNQNDQYFPHPVRTAFMFVLNAMGGMPQKCKTVAVSMGSAIGKRSKKYYNTNERSPGDHFLDVTGFAYVRYLLKVLPHSFVEVELKSANIGHSTVYKSLGFVNEWFVPFNLFGWKPVSILKSVYRLNKRFKASIKSYDLESGGQYIVNWGSTSNFNSALPEFLLPIIHAFNYNISLGSDNWIAGAEAGLGFLGGFGGVSVVKSKGFGFNFVPLRSALDLAGDLQNPNWPTSPNLETWPVVSTITNNTPFDVVLAVASRNIFDFKYNYRHTKVNNPYLLYSPGDTIKHRTCSWYSHLLNREIGDEKLYLENLDLSFPYARFRTEYDIYVNERNPAYKYPSGFNNLKYDPAAFSKEEDFTIQNTVDFLSDETTALTFSGKESSPGFLYNTPQTGTWNHTDIAYSICCSSPYQRKKRPIFDPPQEINTQWLGEYNSQQQFEIHEIESELLNYQVFSMQGKLVNEGTWQYQENHLYSLSANLPRGMYVLRVNRKIRIKFIVS